MDKKLKKYSMEEIQEKSYRELQKISKSLNLISNVKKIHLQNLIYAKLHGTADDIEDILEIVKEERLNKKQYKDLTEDAYIAQSTPKPTKTLPVGVETKLSSDRVLRNRNSVCLNSQIADHEVHAKSVLVPATDIKKYTIVSSKKHDKKSDKYKKGQKRCVVPFKPAKLQKRRYTFGQNRAGDFDTVNFELIQRPVVIKKPDGSIAQINAYVRKATRVKRALNIVETIDLTIDDNERNAKTDDSGYQTERYSNETVDLGYQKDGIVNLTNDIGYKKDCYGNKADIRYEEDCHGNLTANISYKDRDYKKDNLVNLTVHIGYQKDSLGNKVDSFGNKVDSFGNKVDSHGNTYPIMDRKTDSDNQIVPIVETTHAIHTYTPFYLPETINSDDISKYAELEVPQELNLSNPSPNIATLINLNTGNTEAVYSASELEGPTKQISLPNIPLYEEGDDAKSGGGLEVLRRATVECYKEMSLESNRNYDCSQSTTSLYSGDTNNDSGYSSVKNATSPLQMLEDAPMPDINEINDASFADWRANPWSQELAEWLDSLPTDDGASATPSTGNAPCMLDVRVTCLICPWVGPKFVLDHHLKTFHQQKLLRLKGSQFVITISLSSIMKASPCLNKIVEAPDSEVYVVSVAYANADHLLLNIFTMAIDGMFVDRTATITIYNKETGEPYTQNLAIQDYPTIFTMQNSLQIPFSKLNLLPRSSLLDYKKTSFITDGVGDHMGFDDIFVTLDIHMTSCLGPYIM